MADEQSAGNQEEEGQDKAPKVGITKPADTGPAEETTRQPEKKWYQGPVSANNVVSLATLLVGILIAWIYWQQLQVMSGQLSEMQGTSSQNAQLIVNAINEANATRAIAENAFKQVEAAKTQATNTGKAVDATVEQSRLDQRAWVGPKFTASIKIVPGEVATCEVVVTNTGRTPALNVWVKATVTTQETGETPTFNYPERPTAQPRFGMIFPGDGQKIVVPSIDPIGAGLVEQLQSKKRILRFYGLVHYQDIFRRTHETKFCYSIREDMSTVHPCTAYSDESTIYSDAN